MLASTCGKGWVGAGGGGGSGTRCSAVGACPGVRACENPHRPTLSAHLGEHGAQAAGLAAPRAPVATVLVLHRLAQLGAALPHDQLGGASHAAAARAVARGAVALARRVPVVHREAAEVEPAHIGQHDSRAGVRVLLCGGRGGAGAGGACVGDQQHLHHTRSAPPPHLHAHQQRQRLELPRRGAPAPGLVGGLGSPDAGGQRHHRVPGGPRREQRAFGGRGAARPRAHLSPPPPPPPTCSWPHKGRQTPAESSRSRWPPACKGGGVGGCRRLPARHQPLSAAAAAPGGSPRRALAAGLPASFAPAGPASSAGPARGRRRAEAGRPTAAAEAESRRGPAAVGPHTGRGPRSQGGAAAYGLRGANSSRGDAGRANNWHPPHVPARGESTARLPQRAGRGAS